MTDSESLLEVMLARPKEDTPRLAYADYLQEHGQPHRAAFVRAQVALTSERDPVAREGLYRREWAAFRCRAAEGWGVPELFESPPDEIEAFDRGVLHSLACTAAECEKHLDAVAAVHPIRTVQLTDVVELPKSFAGSPAEAGSATTFTCARWPAVEFHLAVFQRTEHSARIAARRAASERG